MENSLIGSVIQEIEQAFDRTRRLQSLVELGNCSDTLKLSARVLSEEVLQACNSTLSVLKSQESCSVKSQRKVVPIRRNLRRNYARKEVTAAPYNDGHEWRKYGEKRIKDSIFTRSYYRCTYSEDKRCQAKKQVQQKDCGAPSLFLVIYEGEHTCNSLSTILSEEKIDDGVQHMMQVQGSNTSFPITAVNPRVEPLLLRFDSEDNDHEMKVFPSPMITVRENISERTMNWQSESLCKSTSKLASVDLITFPAEPMEPSLPAIHGSNDDIVLDEVFHRAHSD